MLKWGTVIAVTYVVYRFLGHWALAVIAVPVVVGTAVHFTWCRRHGIDPLRATPRQKYYRLRGWTWVE